ncbi:MAG: hypothetical protein AAF997_17830, partial [Myxococcota bacterium]
PELRFYCNDFHKDTKSIVNATGTYDPLTGELTIRHIQPGGAAITLENARPDRLYWQNQAGGH